MPPASDPPPESLSLLPTVLQHLPTLLSKPNLASQFFLAIRKSSQTPPPHLTPLLPPLTILTLNTTSSSLRHDATATCLSLLRALTHSNFSSLATAYVQDLVDTAYSLVHHSHAQPLHPPFHAFISAASNHPSSTIPITPLSSLNLPPVPVSPLSLQSLLYLLASLIPAPAPPVSPDLPSTNRPTPFPPTDDLTATTLWISVGSASRTALVDLAANFLLLSSRCGPDLATSALTILQRACDIPAASVIPCTTLTRLQYVLEDVLIRESLPDPVRVHVYTLAKMIHREARLPARLWIAAGVRDAVRDDALLGRMLRTWSREGGVEFVQGVGVLWTDARARLYAVNRESEARGEEPARKKRRVAEETAGQSSMGESAIEEALSSQGAMFPGGTGQWPRTVVEALTREVCELGTIERCVEDVGGTKILVRVVAILVDMLRRMKEEGREEGTSVWVKFAHWVKFVHSITIIVRDVCASLEKGKGHGVWKWVVELARECVRLVVWLHDITLACKGSKCEEQFSLADIEQNSQGLRSAVVGATAFLYERISTDDDESVEYLETLGSLLWDIGECVRRQEVSDKDRTDMIRLASKFHKLVLEHPLTRNDKIWCPLLKGAIHLECSLADGDGTVLRMDSFEELQGLVEENKLESPSRAAAALFAITDLICSSLRCGGNRIRGLDGSDSKDGVVFPLDVHAWTSLFKEVETIVKGAGADDLIAAATLCLGILLIHAPQNKGGEASSVMVKILWHPTCEPARKLVIDIAVAILALRVDDGHSSSQEEGSAISPPASEVEFLDTWDDVDTSASYRPDLQGFFRLLALELDGRLEKWIKALRSEDIHEIENLDPSPLATVLDIDGNEFLRSKISGLAVNSLVSSSLFELKSWRASLPKRRQISNKEPVGNRSRRKLNLKVWSSFVSHILDDGDDPPSSYVQSFAVLNCTQSSEYRKSGILPGRPPPAAAVANFLSSRMSGWLPWMLNDILASNDFAQQICDLLVLHNQESLWKRLPKYTVIKLLQVGDAATLDSLALRIGKSSKAIVDEVSTDALAQAILARPQGLDFRPEGPNALLYQCLEAPITALIKKRAGKIVQRIVMEIGGIKDGEARRALISLSRIVGVKTRGNELDEDPAGSLVSTHFMLVMDAVNRGLFHSKATKKERIRFTRLLDGVLGLSHAHLHLFVPKILATLKMALDVDRESEALRTEVLLVWRNFLASLGAKRALPHLSSVLAILLPFLPSHEELLVPLITSLVENSSHFSCSNHSEILFLLRIVDHPSLRNTIKKLIESHENALGVDKEHVHQRGTTAKLVQACEDMSRIITQHENGVTEVLAAAHFLNELRSHREALDEYLKGYRGATVTDGDTALSDVASLLGRLVLTLNKSKNDDCQEKLMQCIGEVGALDPAIVQKFNQDSKPDQMNVIGTNLSFNCAIQSLASLLLEDYLVPALARGSQREGPSNNLNRYGLVIQELLRVCGCRRETAARASKTARVRKPNDPPIDWESALVGETEEENGIVFWENLGNTTRTVAEPYLAEPFDVQHYRAIFGGASAGNIQLACQPVWSKVKAATPKGVSASAHEWRRQLVVQMVDYIGKQGKFGEILKALRPILRYDDNIAAHVFPFAVTAALDLQRRVEGTEIQNFLVQEFSLVLRQCSSPQPVFDLFDSLRKWREERCRIRGLVQFRNQRAGTVVPSAAKRRGMAEMSIQRERDLDALSPLIDMDGKEARDLSLLVQASAALASRSYARTVMLAESHVRNMRSSNGCGNWAAVIPSLRGSEGRSKSLDGNGELEALGVLQKAFAELEDSDSMAGIASLKMKPSMEDQIIHAEATGRHDSALVIYERAIAKNPRSASMHEGFLRCLMTLGHWETMLSHSEGLLWSATLEDIELRESSQTLGIDAAWRLGRWDVVEELSRISSRDQGGPRGGALTSLKLDFNAGLGKMLIWLKNGSETSLRSKATEIRKKMLMPLSRLAREGYARAYPMIVLLQMLSDVEDAGRMPQFRDKGGEVWSHDDDLVPLISLDGRERASSPSLRFKEPVLSTKRICFEQAERFNEAATVNLRLAELSHEANNLRAAAAYAFQASSTPFVESGIFNDSVIKQAKIAHAQGDASGALLKVKAEIERLLEIRKNSMQGNESDTTRLSERLSTAYLLAGKWIEEAKSEPSNVILDYFEQSTHFGHTGVEPFYALGRHFDMLLQAGANATSDAVLPTDARASRRAAHASSPANSYLQVVHYVPLVIKSFARALCNGHSRIFEAVPRMLTVWFDYHSAVHCPDSKISGSPVEDSVNREMKKAFRSIPLYMWMTAIPQLMSRLLHPRKQVADELSQLLSRVFVAYPDQCVWLILPSSLLKSESRKKATKLIVSFVNQANRKTKRGALVCSGMNAEQMRALHSKIVTAYNVLQRFVDICVTVVPKEKRGRVDNCRNEFLGLRNLLDKGSSEHNPIIPTLETLTAKLPGRDGSSEHRAFSQESPVIVDIDDNALVLSSMMRPRRISLLGSDGRKYRFLAKKETAGDMRKDSRLMEFVTVVNRLLSKDSASCRRELELKTYAVLPLTEEAGMLEWVNDLDPMRKLVRDQQVGIENLPDTVAIQKKYTGMSDKKRFLEWAIEQCPPMLDRFFLQQFGGGTNPEAWLKARNLWTRSVAGWSMAGYIVGLGDRHGENVLIETTTGRCVHVDFAMLFDKGLTLRVPEIVPFRLTPNMVTAMGIAGYEGSFRTVSEVAMGVMRRNVDALLGVLETFLHDPLADWGKGETRAANGTIIANKEAWQTRTAVKAKLTGMVDDSGLPLSIKGQVERLIHEATSLDNLSKMYIWWSGWI